MRPRSLVFGRMLGEAWKSKKATSMFPHALAVAEWLIQPVARNLGPMIGAQEYLLSKGMRPLLVLRAKVRKVFVMTHPERKLDHDAVRRLAKARRRNSEPGKMGYNHVEKGHTPDGFAT